MKSICPKYECNERLEFLGDAVLELVSSEFLFFEHPDNAGRRTDEDSEPAWCANRHWHSVHERLNLESICFLAKERMQPEEGRRESVTSDAMEALIGAIYLDGGFANAKEFIQQIYS